MVKWYDLIVYAVQSHTKWDKQLHKFNQSILILVYTNHQPPQKGSYETME